MPNKTLGYGRVSTAKQATEGTSPESQRDDFLRFVAWKRPPAWELCAALGDWEGTWFFDAGQSSDVFLMQRPAGAAMCAVLEPGDHVVIPLFDRGFRSAGDVEAVLKHFRAINVTMHICDFPVDTATIMGEAFLSIMGAIKRLEKQTILERTRRGKLEAIKHGLPKTPTFGWKFSKQRVSGHNGKQWLKVIVDVEARREAQEIVRLIDEEGWTQEGLVIQWWKEKRRNWKGREWNQRSISLAYHSAKNGFPNKTTDLRLELCGSPSENSPGPSTAMP